MKTSNRLTTLQLPALLKQPGRHRDGDGLILLVRDNGSAFWVLRYMLGGKARELGLGPLRLVNLAEARARAREARQALLDKRDPVEIKHAALQARKIEQLKTLSFREACEMFLATDKIQKLKDPSGWRYTLALAVAKLGDLPLQEIRTPHIHKVLLPICEKTPETGSRLRGRLERVFAWAIALEFYTGPNPASLVLRDTLPAKPKQKHHAAMPYGDVPAFMAELRKRDSMSARALELTILCAARTSETIGARWDEIDLDSAMWCIPGERMKAKKPHRVPLSDRAVEILRSLATENHAMAHVFLNGGGLPLSNMAMLELMKGMKANGVPHGFRSSFSDWCRDRTAWPRDVVEMALAHTIKDKSERAYRRGDALEKRARLMQQWADYLGQPAAAGENIVSLRSA